MNNFQIEFKRLKADRGLSNKQIASFTGVKVKEVKQWEAGTSFPTDKKIINALEGLLGTEITQTLDGFSTCLLYTSPSPRDLSTSRMPSSA